MLCSWKGEKITAPMYAFFKNIRKPAKLTGNRGGSEKFNYKSWEKKFFVMLRGKSSQINKLVRYIYTLIPLHYGQSNVISSFIGVEITFSYLLVCLLPAGEV